jgi:non-specific serine/threonine protein kinase
MGAKPLLELSSRGREAAGATRSRAPEAPPRRSLALRREGDVWVVDADAKTIRLRHTKGFAYLEQLVAHAGRELHVLVLVGAEHGDGDAGAILDARAKAEYQRRISDLDERIEHARALGDDQGVARARAELDAVAEQLAAAVGLGGRDRRAASRVSRARINVQRRLKDAIAAIAALDATLGRYLKATIKTGTFCSYQPL